MKKIFVILAFAPVVGLLGGCVAVRDKEVVRESGPSRVERVYEHDDDVDVHIHD